MYAYIYIYVCYTCSMLRCILYCVMYIAWEYVLFGLLQSPKCNPKRSAFSQVPLTYWTSKMYTLDEHKPKL